MAVSIAKALKVSPNKLKEILVGDTKLDGKQSFGSNGLADTCQISVVLLEDVLVRTTIVHGPFSGR